MAPTGMATAQTTLANLLLADEGSFDRFRQELEEFSKFARLLAQEQVAQELKLGDMAYMIGVPVVHVTELANGGKISPHRVKGPWELPYSDAQAEGSIDFGAASTYLLDLREKLRDGHEPLMDILSAAKALKPEQDLVIITTFHAEPIRRLLGYRGFVSFAEKLAADHWQIRFRHRARASTKRTESGCCGSCGGR